MKRSLIVNQSPIPVTDEKLEHIWKRLAAENAWPDGRCPDAERRLWVGSIAGLTLATLVRVERVGVECGVISPSVDGWGVPVNEGLWEHVPTERTCAGCKAPFVGKGRAAYCLAPACQAQRNRARRANATGLTSTQAAERLGVHRQEVIGFARAGRLTRRTSGEHSVWDPAEVDALAAELRAERQVAA